MQAAIVRTQRVCILPQAYHSSLRAERKFQWMVNRLACERVGNEQTGAFDALNW